MLSLVDSLVLFFVLQVADFLTTVAVIYLGGGEQNPLVAGFIGALGTVNGLILAKTVVIAGGTVAALAKKRKVLRLANIVFVAVILWNVLVIGRLLAHSGGPPQPPAPPPAHA